MDDNLASAGARRARMLVLGVIAAGALLVPAFGGCALSRSGTRDVTCSSAAECVPPSQCQTGSCSPDGICVFEPLPDGRAPEQQDADCRVTMCASGNPVFEPDGDDVVDDGNECTIDTCVDGEPVYENAMVEAPCTVDGLDGYCDGSGNCLEGCSSDQMCVDYIDDDPAQGENPCTIDSCDFREHTCAHDPNPNPAQTPGDCQIVLCDGGAPDPVDDNSDLPNDNNECTVDSCVAGAPDYQNVPDLTPCGPTMLGICDAGLCKGCTPETVATQCGADTFCLDWECPVDTCLQNFTASGTALPAQNQTSSDCAELQCDGSGNVVPVLDSNDAEIDSNPCTNDVCLGPMQPAHPDKPAGASCDDGLFCTSPMDECDGNGNCVQFNPCPGHNVGSNCADSCNESADNCTANDTNGTSCDDNVFCNGVDTCQGGTCNHPGNPCPGHNVGPGCADSCNEGADNCTANDTNGTSCNDSVFCNGVDTCQSGTCNHPGNPCPGHNIGPTCNDSCNESTDACTSNDQNGTSCNDDVFCNGVDTCQSGTCNHPGNPCPGHNAGPACDDSCNESAENCTANDQNGGQCTVSIPNDGSCQSGGCLLDQGQPCNDDTECSTGDCEDNVCCDVACVGACIACTAAIKGQGIDGVCGNVAAGVDTEEACDNCCNGNGSCGGSDTCLDGQPCDNNNDCINDCNSGTCGP
jgi:hypothetical protein